ncbi:class I SAM-dependent methyltransferase [Portibacter marinus]|uniref:class I SAM-dependent methyltransferase n=1 Tax=Portibacter marinus TaxID=2898660 RepID=UPI001F16F9DE|nr:class I SAM-dependent methyltransferase [Portibacter marinus]
MKGQEKEKAIDEQFYFSDGYFNRSQIDSLTTQLILVHEKKPSRILEIGPGNGFVSDFLKKGGFEVVTFDINEKLNPTVVGDLTKLNQYFTKNQFDLILCAEVLEHLPFDEFEGIIKQISQISQKWVILTLPNRHKNILDLSLSFRIRNQRTKNLNFQLRSPSRGVKWEGHFWEINYSKATTIKEIERIISKYLYIDKSYLEPRNRYHHFFELRTKENEQ